MLMCDHLHPPDPYNQIVEAQLCETGFYYVSQIGVIKGQSAMINALIERWRPETHTFHFPIGECAVTLEDVVVILGLPTNGLPVTGPTMSSFEALEAECLHQFGIASRKNDCRGSFIKLTWFRGLKDRIVLNDDVHMQMYVKCHIMLFETILFADNLPIQCYGPLQIAQTQYITRCTTFGGDFPCTLKTFHAYSLRPSHTWSEIEQTHQTQVKDTCTKYTILSYIFENLSSHKSHLLIPQMTM
ncbi:hypothetical protein Ahy_B03g064110 [Arachis hypogaea]|uniref:Aminotransferase-like plant mobile domain-containing protein n=1 Tax=Arachis hypogaea TaxID=3818 RepID=A0A444ZYP3_ARAHY|nr:hypothetical protein Ahy_B03g064110 [Arachis hypogaea]